MVQAALPMSMVAPAVALSSLRESMSFPAAVRVWAQALGKQEVLALMAAMTLSSLQASDPRPRPTVALLAVQCCEAHSQR